MLIKRFVGSVFYHAYSRAIQSACKPLASALAKSVKHTLLLHTSVKLKLSCTVCIHVIIITSYFNFKNIYASNQNESELQNITLIYRSYVSMA